MYTLPRFFTYIFELVGRIQNDENQWPGTWTKEVCNGVQIIFTRGHGLFNHQTGDQWFIIFMYNIKKYWW